MRRALTRLPLPPPGELGQAKVTLSPWGELAGVTANWSQPERERERDRTLEQRLRAPETSGGLRALIKESLAGPEGK